MKACTIHKKEAIYKTHSKSKTNLAPTLPYITAHAHRTSISGHAQTLPPNRYENRTIEHPGHVQRTLPPEHVHRTS